jgi:hypothetical protein
MGSNIRPRHRYCHGHTFQAGHNVFKPAKGHEPQTRRSGHRTLASSLNGIETFHALRFYLSFPSLQNGAAPITDLIPPKIIA